MKGERGYYERESLEHSVDILIICFYSAASALMAGGLMEIFFDGWVVNISALIGAIIGLFAGVLFMVSGKCSRVEERESVLASKKASKKMENDQV